MLLGCAPRQLPPERGPPAEVYAVEAHATVRTEATGSPALREAIEAIAAFTLHLSLEIAQAPGERHADGSQALILRFLRSEARIGETWRATDLQGRTVSLRRFADGEVLGLEGLERAAGPGRGVEALDLLIPLLSPAPPRLPEGGAAEARARWPLRLPGTGVWEAEIEAQWMHGGMTEVNGERAFSLLWSGPWRGRGRWEVPQARAAAEGWVAGGLEVLRRDGALRHHWIEAERRLRVELASGAGGLRQAQHLFLTLDRQGDTAASPSAPGRLDEAALRRGLEAGLAGFRACLVGNPIAGPTLVQLDLQVDGDGEVAGASARGALPASMLGCLESTAAGLHFVAHGDVPVGVVQALLVTGENVLLSPVPKMEQRDLSPAFLLLPADLPAAALGALRAALAAEVSPPAGAPDNPVPASLRQPD